MMSLKTFMNVTNMHSYLTSDNGVSTFWLFHWRVLADLLEAIQCAHRCKVQAVLDMDLKRSKTVLFACLTDIKQE
jgi:hypothetical protein